jgi:hypothetical protein
LAPIPDHLRLAWTFDVRRLAEDLGEIRPSDWIPHFVRENYRGDWSVVPLRGPAGASHPVLMIYPDPTTNVFADTPFLARCPYFREVIGTFRCPVQAARLMKLKPGSVILPHRDHDLGFDNGVVRIHVPIVTDAGVDFRLNGRRLPLLPGECWYLRLSDPHSVRNEGPDDRVHLVVDVEIDAWMRDVFDQAMDNHACVANGSRTPSSRIDHHPADTRERR